MNLDSLEIVREFIGAALAAATLPGTIELLLLTIGGLLRVPLRRLSNSSGRMQKGRASDASGRKERSLRLAAEVPAPNEEAGNHRCL